MTDPTNLIVEAERCRRLARAIDEQTSAKLLERAQELEARARMLLAEEAKGCTDDR